MFTTVGDWWRARNVERNRRELIRCESKSTFRAALSSLAPHSDLRRWKRWADRCPPHLQELPKDIPDDVPYKGLRNFWYPVMPAKDLRANQLQSSRLLGEDLVVFRDEDGSPRALSDVCPHRLARLSQGWVNLHAPGTVSCPYHGWTFDGSGQCVAALAEGPDSPLPRKTRTRAYPALERHHVIWAYMGDPDKVPDLDENIPHVAQAMSGSWPWFIHWDWDCNYLNSIDNNADAAHACFAHARCSQFLDQARYGKHYGLELECGGLEVGMETTGPDHRGSHYASGWDMHVPGYIYFAPHPPIWPAGAIFWSVPIDEGKVRVFTCATFHGEFKDRARAWIMQSVHWRKWGLPNNIYHCNIGPDRAMVMGQGMLSDWRREHLSQTDVAVIKFRQMLKKAWQAERLQAAEVEPRSRRVRAEETFTEA